MYCFNIISSKYNCSIPLERRITVLRGDSGTGKSTVIDMIEANDPQRDLQTILSPYVN